MQKFVECDKSDYTILSGIWERSVRATHYFLTEDDIKNIRNALIPNYFPNVNLYGLSVDGTIVGFIGLSGNKIEMLFVDSDKRGMGYGSSLMKFAKEKGVTLVDVNEQNPSALGFYRAKGFIIISRDEVDEAGRPFPILHLSL